MPPQPRLTGSQAKKATNKKLLFLLPSPFLQAEEADQLRAMEVEEADGAEQAEAGVWGAPKLTPHVGGRHRRLLGAAAELMIFGNVLEEHVLLFSRLHFQNNRGRWEEDRPLDTIRECL